MSKPGLANEQAPFREMAAEEARRQIVRVQALERVSTGAQHRCVLVQASRRTARLATVPVKMAE
jgi:hypothetical protein